MKNSLSYKKMIFFSLISICLTIILLLNINTKYIALYLASSHSTILNTENLKKNNILKLDSLDELKAKTESLNYKTGLIIDKSILENNNDEMKELNNWLLQQKNYPIIVLGYGNPSYVYFKKLTFSNKKNIPFDDEEFENFSKEKGFSLAYICSNNYIYGKGFKDTIEIDKILEVVDNGLKDEQHVIQMLGDS